jgi:hypothetical protein
MFHFFCSLALRFFNRVVTVRVSFSALRLVYIRISLSLFPNSLANGQAYFLCNQLGKYQTPFLLFPDLHDVL